MSKSGPGAKHLPTNKKTTAEYMTPHTLAGKKGVESMGVPKPAERDYSKRSSLKKIDESPEKISTYSLNKNSMSKSLFEKLFEDVMDGADFSKPTDEETLGIEGGEDLGDEDLGGGEDEVTFTLDRATAEKLHAVLGSILGGGEEQGEEQGAGEEFGEEGGEGEEYGDEDNAFGEGIEIVPEPQKLSTSYKDGKNNKEIHGSKLNKSQGGTAKSGDIPEPKGNPQALGDKSKSLQGKANKVQGFTTKGSMFDL
jgi:hypothetical protein